jgi:nucleoside-diphosphate-sugar epimerase
LSERRPTVLVTGASGFLGRRVVPLLVAQGRPVRALVRSTTAASRVAELGADPLAGDLDDPESVDAAFAASGSTVLVNLASMGFGHAPTIVAAAEEHGLRRAVFVSTTSIYTTLSSASKAVRVEAERLVQTSGLDWTILRPTMIYGAPDDRNMARLLRLLRRWPIVPVPGGGTGLQQPVHVDDLAAAIVNCLERPGTIGHDYDLAGPEPLSLRETIEQAAAAVDRRPVCVPIPLRPTIAMTRLYDRLSPKPLLTTEQVARLAEDKAVDTSAARDDLQFAPRSFAEGIRAEARLLRRRA